MTAADTGSAGPRPWWRKRRVRWPALLLVIALLIYGFRHPLLRGIGHFLIVEDPVAHADAIYVLGGSAVDRGKEAARLYRQGLSDKVVCTGSTVPTDLEAMGIDRTESDCAARVVEADGVPADRVVSLHRGTSTLEEAIALLDQARTDGADTVIIVSDHFHTRRIQYVFHDRFREAGITVLVHGAPSRYFDTDAWWRTEEGLLMVYNEYLKLVYYHIKY